MTEKTKKAPRKPMTAEERRLRKQVGDLEARLDAAERRARALDAGAKARLDRLREWAAVEGVDFYHDDLLTFSALARERLREQERAAEFEAALKAEQTRTIRARMIADLAVSRAKREAATAEEKLLEFHLAVLEVFEKTGRDLFAEMRRLTGRAVGPVFPPAGATPVAQASAPKPKTMRLDVDDRGISVVSVA